ncbi:aldehyde dehydrogenase family protein [Streptomyces sp. JNUCC 64]
MTTAEALSVEPTVRQARAAFDRGRTAPLVWRRRQLRGLISMLKEHGPEWERALASDLGKPADEVHLTEIGIVLSEARHALSSLRRWAAPRRVRLPWYLLPGSARTRPAPRGVALVIAPWNYPLQLQLAPTVGALAAGCAVVLKPSEHAPATAALLAELVPRHLDPEAVRVATGGAEVAQSLLDQKFDQIFYTGGDRVGRVVAAAAAARLTPAVLELGGACPVWVDESADVPLAARRIVWAKLLASGQTCVAPNHVFVAEKVHDRMLEAIRDAIARQLGDDARRSPDFARVVSDTHVERLEELLRGRDVHVGGDSVRHDRYLAPTVVAESDPHSPLMSEETFGPILPVCALRDVDEFIALQRARAHPLAIYGFARSRPVLDRIEHETTSGAFGRNVLLTQLQVHGLPFGGVGASGHGAYHGKRSFDVFSYEKAVVSKPPGPDPLDLVIPPHTPLVRRAIRRLITRS